MLHGFTTQMPPPLPPSCTVQSGSGLSAGNYRYVATMIQYYPGNGQGETPPSAASSTLTTTSGNEQIAVTLPALPPGLDAYNIYRTKHGGSGTYYLVASSLSPGTYVDSTPDSSLVTPVSSANTTGAGQITGSMSPTGGPRLVNFSVSGTATLLVPFNGPAYKRVMLYVTSGSGTATFNYYGSPTFTTIAKVTYIDSGITVVVTLTTVVVTGTGTSGIVIIEGY